MIICIRKDIAFTEVSGNITVNVGGLGVQLWSLLQLNFVAYNHALDMPRLMYRRRLPQNIS